MLQFFVLFFGDQRITTDLVGLTPLSQGGVLHPADLGNPFETADSPRGQIT